MIQMALSEAAEILDARFSGADVHFTGCGTDSRNISKGQMFIALQGDHFDGHNFIEEAVQKGASCVMAETTPFTEVTNIKVANTLHAMTSLAAVWRSRFSIPIIAVTGSNGKTTVKEMLGKILACQGCTYLTPGNFNNHIGVPLSLFNLDETHRYAVIEMGASHVGEIAELTSLVQPHVALITQCAPAHLEGFGSIEQVAQAKAEIYSGLEEAGVAIINADDAFADLWRSKCTNFKQLTFAIEQPATFSAKQCEIDFQTQRSTFILDCPDGTEPIWLPLLGRHNVMNALAASACAYAVGISSEDIKKGLEQIEPVPGRLQFKQASAGAQIIDDSYNANPASLVAALKVLSHYEGRKWLLLADMGELGEAAKQFHTEAGHAARKHKVERLLTLGDLSFYAGVAFGTDTKHFESYEGLVDYLNKVLEPGLVLLVKGSRAMRLERVIESLEQT